MNKDKYVISYAQNREDIILSAFFLGQKKGYYVDVGANDPDIDSVTKYFYDQGWSGINIEPSPTLYKKLEDARNRDINLNVGISDHIGELEFREYEGNGLSTFSSSRKKELSNFTENNVKHYKDYKVKVQTLKQLFLSQNISSIDFMKIDVEGYEFEVIRGNDWDKYRPKVLCIEANHIKNDWSKILTDTGYEKVFNDGLNDYYIDSSAVPAIHFDYLNAAVGRQVVPSYAISHINDITSLKSDIESAINQAQKLELENQLIKEKISPLIYENEALRTTLKEQGRLRSQVKTLLRSLDAIAMTHINKLNVHKQEIVDAEQQLSKVRDANKTLLEIKTDDIKNFYNKSNGIAVRDRKLHVIVLSSYLFIKRALRYILVLVWKFFKVLKRAVK